MPEGMNVHVAHKLSERERADRAKRRWQEVIEILEVLALAIAAVATAWLQARGAGDSQLQAEPFTDPAAPPGPGTCRSTAIPSWSRPSGSTPRPRTPSRRGRRPARPPTGTRG